MLIYCEFCNHLKHKLDFPLECNKPSFSLAFVPGNFSTFL